MRNWKPDEWDLQHRINVSGKTYKAAHKLLRLILLISAIGAICVMFYFFKQF